MFESKLIKKDHETDFNDLSEYDNFLNEFANGKNDNEIVEDTIEEYPVLPKIKDLDGNILKNLMQIDII